jgi:hypothetical protein
MTAGKTADTSVIVVLLELLHKLDVCGDLTHAGKL